MWKVITGIIQHKENQIALSFYMLHVIMFNIPLINGFLGNSNVVVVIGGQLDKGMSWSWFVLVKGCPWIGNAIMFVLLFETKTVPGWLFRLGICFLQIERNNKSYKCKKQSRNVLSVKTGNHVNVYVMVSYGNWE